MKLRLQKNPLDRDETEWAAYFGDSAEETPRILSCTKGKSKAFIMIADNGDPRTGEEAAKVCADSFMRRPSLKSRAIQTICGFMNNAVLARCRPNREFCFDAAMVFLLGNEAAWSISGDAAVLWFVDGKIYRRSENKTYPCMGISPYFEADMQGPFPIQKGENAILLCTRALIEKLDAEELEQLLADAGDPRRWMSAILERCGGDPDGSMLTAILPPPKNGLFGR